MKEHCKTALHHSRQGSLTAVGEADRIWCNFHAYINIPISSYDSIPFPDFFVIIFDPFVIDMISTVLIAVLLSFLGEDDLLDDGIK